MTLRELLLKVIDRRTGSPLLRVSARLVNKEVRDGTWIALTADTDDGRRILLDIPSELLEFIEPPPPALPPEKAGNRRRVSAEIGRTFSPLLGSDQVESDRGA
jgi:hypothetical protein